jgi:predicted nucleotidyltransferase
MTRNEIMNVLKGDYNSLIDKEYQLYGIFLFGSQNYGLSTENSDIDVKVIYFPREEEKRVAMLLNVMTATKSTYDRNNPSGQVTALTPETFIENLGTSYHTWIELLYTNYYFINSKYEENWRTILSLRDRIARHNTYKFLDAQLDCLVNQIDTAFIGTEDVLCNKRLSTFYRIFYLTQKYCLNLPYQLCLSPTEKEKEKLLMIKNVAPYSREECIEQTKKIIEDMIILIDNYKKENENIIDEDVLEEVARLLVIREEGDESAI